MIKNYPLQLILKSIFVLGVSAFLTEKSLDLFNMYFPDFTKCRLVALLICTSLWVLLICCLIRKFSVSEPSQEIEDVDTNIPAVYGINDHDELKTFANSFLESRHFSVIKSILNFIVDKQDAGSTLVVNGAHRSGKTTVVACVAKLYNYIYEDLDPFLKFLNPHINKQPNSNKKIKFIYEPAIRFGDFNEYMMNILTRFGDNSDLREIIRGLIKKDLHTVFIQLALISKSTPDEESILIIDDIDRLNPDEIITILKFKLLVEQRKIKNFKLVLVWDESNLLRVLKSGYPYIDRRYLDKYIDPVNTKQVGIDDYGELWKEIVGKFAESKSIDSNYVMICALENEIKKELTKLDVSHYDITLEALREKIQSESNKFELINTKLIETYISLPRFRNPERIYDFDTDQPIRSLYSNDTSLMLCEFQPGGCQDSNHESCTKDENGACIDQCEGNDGLYCSTINNSQYIPNWSSTLEAFDDIDKLNDTELNSLKNISSHTHSGNKPKKVATEIIP